MLHWHCTSGFNALLSLLNLLSLLRQCRYRLWSISGTNYSLLRLHAIASGLVGSLRRVAGLGLIACDLSAADGGIALPELSLADLSSEDCLILPTHSLHTLWIGDSRLADCRRLRERGLLRLDSWLWICAHDLL